MKSATFYHMLPQEFKKIHVSGPFLTWHDFKFPWKEIEASLVRNPDLQKAQVLNPDLAVGA